MNIYSWSPAFRLIPAVRARGKWLTLAAHDTLNQKRRPCVTMAKKKGQASKALPITSMYPALHPEVSEVLEQAGLHFTFRDGDDEHDILESWDSAVMGRFRCHNAKCAADGWGSKQISLTIRMFPGEQYNAKVYHQRCKRCNSVSKPILDETYTERVTYWLKKWNGVRVERPPNSGKVGKGPHQRELCEGCRAGHCITALREDMEMMGL